MPAGAEGTYYYLLPPELEKEFVLVDMPLPDKDSLAVIAGSIAASAKVTCEDKERSPCT